MSLTGLVLSGGGARGAYEVGVLLGLAEVTDACHRQVPLFQVVAGTSVGALNGAWTVANGHRGDHGYETLADAWRRLSLQQHLRLDLRGLLGWAPFRWGRRHNEARLGRSVLDPAGIEALVKSTVHFEHLHRNIADGVIRAFVVAALHVGSGVTTLFTEVSPGVKLAPMRHPRRRVKRELITVDHVLASAAIPVLFPARKVGRSHFVDGSLRFNTPIAPVIRAGAEKLVVISLKHEAGELPAETGEEQYPDPFFLVGKLLNALLLDPVSYDLQVLEGLNRVMGVLDETLTSEERARFDQVLVDARGSTYRRIPTLSFEPSQNISLLAGQYLQAHLHQWQLGTFYEWILGKAAAQSATWESDLASYLMFDGGWADALIALGKRDVHARRDEVCAFFEA